MPIPAWMLAALVGGGTSTATGYMRGNRGDDLWKDALIGAVMGAGTSGLGSLFQGSQAAAAEAAQTAAVTGGKLNLSQTTKDLITKKAATAKGIPWRHIKNKSLGKALDPFGASGGDLGKYAYLTTPAAGMTGQMMFGDAPKMDPKKQFVPPFNVHYGRDPGAYGFGDWFDEDAIKGRYEEGSMDYPYYYPEMAQGGMATPDPGSQRGDWEDWFLNMEGRGPFAGSATPKPNTADMGDWKDWFLKEGRRGYQEGGLPAALGAGLGGSQEGTTDAIQSLLAEYYNQEEQVFDDETIQALIEQVLSQQTGQYQPMSGIAGQLQGMTQQYAGQQPQQPQQQPGGYNYGGDVRRHYQEGAFGEDMLASGDLDMRPGGESVGPGTGTSDDIPAMLSDGEFVMTSEAVEGAGGGDREMGAQRMMNMMKNFEGGGLPSLQSQGLGAPEEMMAEESVMEMGPQGMMSESMMEEEIV